MQPNKDDREQVEAGSAQYADDSYFGVCPYCFHTDGYLNIGRTHLGTCDTHRVYWEIGGNLFSDWKDENEEIWESNRQLIRSYTKVKPFRSTDTAQETN
jgi:hypothetical protein